MSRARRAALCAVVAIAGHATPAHAIPPPELLGVVGGLVLAPLLLVLPLLLLPLHALLARTWLAGVRVRLGHVAGAVLLLAGVRWAVPRELAAGVPVAAIADSSLFVDVRPARNFADCHVNGATHAFGRRAIFDAVGALATRHPGRAIVLYCFVGVTSSALAGELAGADRSLLGRVTSVRDGAAALAASERVRVVRTAPRELVDRWVEAGDYARVEVAGAVNELAFAGLSGPVAVYSESREIDALDARLAAVYSGPLVYARSAAVEPPYDSPFTTPMAPFPHVAAVLRKAAGGTWGVVVALFMLELALLWWTRRRMLRAVFAAKTAVASRWRWAAMLTPLGFTFLVAQLALAGPEHYGRDFTTVAGASAAFYVGYLGWFVLWVALAVAFANPLGARTERLRKLEVGLTPGRAWEWLLALVLARLAVELFMGRASTPVLLAVLLGLLAPSLLDLLHGWSLRRRGVLDWIAGPLADGEVCWELETRSEHPARFVVRAGERRAEVGAFTARVLGGALAETTSLAHLIGEARRLREGAGTDLRLGFTASGGLAAMQPMAPLPDNDVHEVLMRQVGAGAVDCERPRFVRDGYEEVAQTPTPLTLDLLRARWRRGGAALRALRAFGVRVRPSGEPLVGLGALYKDHVREEERFAAPVLARRLRAYLLERYATLALESAPVVFAARVEPAARRRMARWQALELRTMPLARARRHVRAALGALSGASAEWQERMALAHQQSWRSLLAALERHGLDPAVTRAPVATAAASYELAREQVPPDPERLPVEVQARLHAWRRAERFRQGARELYLEELGVVAALLQALGARTGLGADIVFLRLDELHDSSLPRATARKAAWEAARELRLGASLSLSELETWVPGGLLAQQPVAWSGVRVSGPARDVTGVARVVLELDGPLRLGPGEILVTPHIEPQWVSGLRGGAGLLTETGGMLSHASIVARELALTALVGARGVSSAIVTGDRLRLRADGGVVVERRRPWRSLAEVAGEPAVGRKAQRLGSLLAHGVAVPPGAVLGHASLEASCAHWGVTPPTFGDAKLELPRGLRARALPATVVRDLAELVETLGSPAGGLIVRSSAAVEDDPRRSFAGQLRSRRCKHDLPELIEAVCACWEAAWSETVRACGDAGSPVVLNLVVQHYVRATVGGVLFTIDPLTRDPRELLIEAARGGAEPVVAGRPELRLRLARTLAAPADAELLAGPDLEELRRLAVQIEGWFGAPQDIEWVLAGQALYILQSRDIPG